MSRGGAREGAGRPKGAPNRVTAEREAEIAASGLTPLDFMLGILRDNLREDVERFEAAKAAAPYCHAKLASTNVDLGGDALSRLAEILAHRRAKVAELNEGADG